MKKFSKSASTRVISTSAAVLALTLVFSFMFLTAKAYAGTKYFNSYYLSINAGGVQIKPENLKGHSVGTLNLSFGKNFNINKFVIGGEVTLGDTGNTTWIKNNFDGYGDNVKGALTKNYYFIAAIKAGYAFKNIMPFVKLGYLDYSDHAILSVSGPYSYAYSAYFPISKNETSHSIMYGAGIEYMFNRTWGISAQYIGASFINSYTIGVDYNF
ncbi:outer membrane protein [Candidatus Acidulodesulfobacterium sp. H_13]|uniref:outer membrane protein n=1 Tax=Candidatus Acidulodesulfobacterium sp. H_13 TaxID=3395470 RepID=UPI003AF61993